MDSLRKDMLLIEKQDEILKSVFAQGIAAGARDLINSLKNPSKKSSGAGAAKETTPDIRDQVLKQVYK